MRDFSDAGSVQTPDQSYTFEQVAEALLKQSRSLLEEMFPAGQVRGPEYVVGDLQGSKGDSLSINVNTGVWTDFADTSKGGADLISLIAAADGITQGEAKTEAERWLGWISPKENISEKISPKEYQAAPAEREVREPAWWEGRAPTKTWTYTDPSGMVFAQVWRWDDPIHGKHIQPAGKIPDKPRPLLYARQVLDAPPGTPIVVVEGEKTADAICEAGFVGTTPMNGAKSPQKADWSPLKGRNVVVWPDNDPAGQEYAQRVAELAGNAGANKVWVVEIPAGKPEKWDAADASPAECQQLIQATLPRKPVSKALDIREWSVECKYWEAGKAPPMKWLVRGVYPLGTPVILASMGGVGKSYLILDLALKIAAGSPTENGKIDFNPPQALGGTVESFGSVVIFSAEDDQDELYRRLDKLDPDGSRRSQAAGKLFLVPLRDASGPLTLVRTNKDGSIEATETLHQIQEQSASLDDVRMIAIDPLLSFVQANINSDTTSGQIAMGYIGMLATHTGATVILSHHMRKGEITCKEDARDAVTGTAALVNGVRSVYALWKTPTDKAQEASAFLGGEAGATPDLTSGAVVKANVEVSKQEHLYERNIGGFLVDVSDRVTLNKKATESPLDALVESIRRAAAFGYPIQYSALVMRRHDLHPALRNLGKHKLTIYRNELLRERRITLCMHTEKQGKWLDVPGGRLAQEGRSYEFGDGECPSLWYE